MSIGSKIKRYGIPHIRKHLITRRINIRPQIFHRSEVTAHDTRPKQVFASITTYGIRHKITDTCHPAISKGGREPSPNLLRYSPWFLFPIWHCCGKIYRFQKYAALPDPVRNRCNTSYSRLWKKKAFPRSNSVFTSSSEFDQGANQAPFSSCFIPEINRCYAVR